MAYNYETRKLAILTQEESAIWVGGSWLRPCAFALPRPQARSPPSLAPPSQALSPHTDYFCLRPAHAMAARCAPPLSVEQPS